MCSLRYFNRWTQPPCCVGSACPPNEAATTGVTSERASHGAVASDVSGSVGVVCISIVGDDTRINQRSGGERGGLTRISRTS